MRSRGPMPRPLRPSTSCWSETPSLTTANFLPSSVTLTPVRGVTTVRPRDSGLGWLTCGLSVIVTVRLPCATATDFEAMFLNSMFSQMTSGLKGEGPFGDTPGTGVWRSMLTEQYSKNFAKAGGVGVAAEVYRTLILQQAKTIRTA